jgi:predicted HicB family RNase H-like nuclease
MENEERYIKTIRVRIEPELLKKVKVEAEKLDTDVSTFVRWCVRTGVYLDDLNLFIKSKINEKDE